jgi:hypothetical protein
MFLVLNLTPCCYVFPPIHHEFLTFKPHGRTHDVVIVTILINTVLTLCYFILSQATLFFYSCIHVITSVMLRSLECTLQVFMSDGVLDSQQNL